MHREGVGVPAVQQGEEEAFNEAVPGAQVEEDQEADLEAEGAAMVLEVVAIVVVVVVVDLVVVGGVEVEVSEGHSSAGSLYCIFLVSFFLSFYLTRWQTRKNIKSRGQSYIFYRYICLL